MGVREERGGAGPYLAQSRIFGLPLTNTFGLKTGVPSEHPTITGCPLTNTSGEKIAPGMSPARFAGWPLTITDSLPVAVGAPVWSSVAKAGAVRVVRQMARAAKRSRGDIGRSSVWLRLALKVASELGETMRPPCVLGRNCQYRCKSP